MTGTILRSLPTVIPDAELLGRFVATRDEPAFAELVRRHGSAVYRMCRRIVGPSAADDAFQATFLVLATRAEKVRKAASVGSWLVGVAGRVARQIRRREANRRCEPPGDLVNRRCEPPSDPDTADLASVLDDELSRLPDALRAPVVACLIQHRTHKQAAAELGESERTLRRRLDEAKRLLRLRLERRGVVPAVAAALVGGVGQVSAEIPPRLTDRAVNLVFDFLAGGRAVASTPAAIAKGVTMSGTHGKVVAAVLAVAIGVTALGVGLAGDPPKTETIPPVDHKQPEPKPPLGDWTVTVHPARAETKNFVVTAVDAVVARAVANEAEHQREAAAEKWLGKELPAWDKPCLITVEVSPTKTSGATTFTFASGDKPPAVNAIEMSLTGSLEKLLHQQVPHEVTHCVLASYFGKPLPRWADEGIAVTAESHTEQAFHDKMVREMLNGGRGIALRKLLPMTDYPKDLPVLYAQGHSLVRFLLGRRVGAAHRDDTKKELKSGEQVLVTFLAQVLNEKMSWADAANGVYGFKDLYEMQEAWLDWLRKPESSLADVVPSQKPTRADELKKDDTLIPPARLGK
jgi:RNA polymerase sigma factor (sigma-70 family)